MIDDKFNKLLDEINNASSILILTGAGVSVESGLPTFRGEEGYWKIGSTNYFPEEMATFRFFKENPNELWNWYRYRQKTYLDASPNKTHVSITNFETWCELNKKNFLLITQNVDNLHRRAKTKNMIEIHGNIFKYRCSIPNSSHAKILYNFKIDDLDDLNPLCPTCNNLLRPHVLWFDEYYDEELFNAETALKKAEKADLLFIIGTTLTTNIPYQLVKIMFQRNKPLVEINPNLVIGSQIKYAFSSKSSLILEELIKNLT